MLDDPQGLMFWKTIEAIGETEFYKMNGTLPPCTRPFKKYYEEGDEDKVTVKMVKRNESIFFC